MVCTFGFVDYCGEGIWICLLSLFWPPPLFLRQQVRDQDQAQHVVAAQGITQGKGEVRTRADNAMLFARQIDIYNLESNNQLMFVPVGWSELEIQITGDTSCLYPPWLSIFFY